MSERFRPFGKPVGSAAGCKAFNDAVSANESQAQTIPQKKTQPLYEAVKSKHNFGDYRGFPELFDHSFHQIPDDR